jgi:hypothetical protein
MNLLGGEPAAWDEGEVRHAFRKRSCLLAYGAREKTVPALLSPPCAVVP